MHDLLVFSVFLRTRALNGKLVSSQLLRRPYHLAMPCMLGSRGNFPLTSQPAAPPVWTLCLWWPRPLAGLLRIPSTLSSASAGPFTTEVGPPTLPQPPVICSAAWQWLCGGATLPSGYTDSPPFLPSWTALSDSLIPLFC